MKYTMKNGQVLQNISSKIKLFTLRVSIRCEEIFNRYFFDFWVWSSDVFSVRIANVNVATMFYEQLHPVFTDVGFNSIS